MNDVSGISFKSRIYSGVVGVRVEPADFNKTDITGESDRKAYRYVKILVGNEAFENSENIAGGSIEFRVPKSWIKENGIEPGTISLDRLEDKGWKRLDTKLTVEEGDFYYFKAETPGFSYYVITGKQQVVVTPAEQQVTTVSSGQGAENSAETARDESAKGQAANGKNQKAPGFGIILSGAGGLIARACFKRR
jgi:PGF-pre-PGF domain-containing protein